MLPCEPAETSTPSRALKNVIRGSSPLPDGRALARHVLPRFWLTRKYGAAGARARDTKPVRPKNCGPKTSHPSVLHVSAGIGSACADQRVAAAPGTPDACGTVFWTAPLHRA